MNKNSREFYKIENMVKANSFVIYVNSINTLKWSFFFSSCRFSTYLLMQLLLYLLLLSLYNIKTTETRSIFIKFLFDLKIVIVWVIGMMKFAFKSILIKVQLYTYMYFHILNSCNKWKMVLYTKGN